MKKEKKIEERRRKERIKRNWIEDVRQRTQYMYVSLRERWSTNFITYSFAVATADGQT